MPSASAPPLTTCRFHAGLILGIAIALLEASRKLGSLAFDYLQVVVRELTPLLLHFAFELRPIAFHAIPIHWVTPFGLMGWGDDMETPANDKCSACGFPASGLKMKSPARSGAWEK